MGAKDRHRRRGPPEEFRRIEWIRRLEAGGGAPSLLVGIGDDAAVWKPAPGMAAVLTVDVQVEGTHFRREWLTPAEIGTRAVAAGVSDLAAMAARPVCILVSVVAGADMDGARFRELHRGISRAARSYGARVAGGNLSNGPFSVSITAIGQGKPSRLLRRSGARPGDEIWVTGSPGMARLGLLCLQRRRRIPARLKAAVERFRRPEARVRAGLAIAGAFRPRSMIDLSDGLSSDLGHILDESARSLGRRMGATLDEGALASLPGLAAAARELGVSPVEACIAGGDDYELLFTTPPARGRDVTARKLSRRLGLSILRIGVITKEPGLRIETRGGRTRRIRRCGWAHF